jgi:hypothetical protein
MNQTSKTGRTGLPGSQVLKRLASLVSGVALVSMPTLAQQQNQGASLTGAIQYELRQGSEDSKRLWLFPKDRAAETVELCETPGWGNLSVHFSPDDYWIIVEDGGGSLGVSLRLFRREKGVRFKELEDADIEGKAELMALADIGLSGKQLLDHRYAKVLAWSADSKTVLVRVSGSGSRNNCGVIIDGWTGLYELASGTISFDLKRFNRQAAKGRKPWRQ